MSSNIDRELTIDFVMMIVGILVALWNVFVFFSTKKSKKASKKSELKAAEYAQQASEFFKVNVKYYEKEMQKQDLELKRLMEHEKRESVYDKKMSILKVVDNEGIITTSRVAKILDLDVLETFDILCELLRHDRMVGSGGNPDRDNVDKNIWTKKKR